MIAYAAWSSLAHGFTMTIMSAQAVAHGMHRMDSPQDIVMFGVIGFTLLALLPPKQASAAGAPTSRKFYPSFFNLDGARPVNHGVCALFCVSDT
jgi:hypothetical protein